MYIFDFIISNFTVFCEEISELPVAAEFQDLHLTDNFGVGHFFFKTIKKKMGLAASLLY
jgi:hypothetical protein